MKLVVKKSKSFIQKLIKEGFVVEQAFLFGSYAQKRAHKYSDIDICVVSPMLGNDFIGDIVILRHQALKIDSRIEPIAFSPTNFNDPYDPLAFQIRKTGIALI